MTPSDAPLADDLIWGLDNIAAYIGRSRTQTFNMLSRGELPGKQINGRWVVSKSTLRAFFDGAAA